MSSEIKLAAAALDRQPVTSLTHGFYRYPARFPSVFARAAIEEFTTSGELVFDPFMGGGTTLVEARVLQRSAIGTDISSLASFIAKVKTTGLTEEDIQQIQHWFSELPQKLNLRNKSQRPRSWIEHGYQRNISGKHTWPMRKTLELALAEVEHLSSVRQQQFIRCLLLKTGQWALDCRRDIPSAKEFRDQLAIHLKEMINGIREYTEKLLLTKSESAGLPTVLCMNRSAEGIENDPRFAELPSPKLILTSPPYPGVHVVYHRWQVQSRRETPAPFWIANSLDGKGESHYTFISRQAQNQSRYFERVQSIFSSIEKISTRESTVVQMVGFSDGSSQLPLYLNAMERAGFTEILLPSVSNSSDGRLWRNVPNRKWYAQNQGTTESSNEVVLFHRLS